MGIDRRSFIAFVVGGTVGVVCSPIPWKLLDDISIWSQNWPWIPKLKYGQRSKVSSVCKLCNGGCGLDVHKVGKRPVTVQGGVEHPLSKGGICPLGACGVRLLYRPARIKGPLKVTNGKPSPISWDEAKQILVERLKGKKVGCISGDETGTASEVLAGLIAKLGSNDFYFMPTDSQSAGFTWKKMNGQGQLGFDLENSDYVLALGADLLSSWGNVVRNQKAFAERKGSWVYAGPHQLTTGASVDKWIPVYPGQEGVLALGIAYYLLQAGKTAGIDNFSEVKDYVLAKYTPVTVEAKTGVRASKVKELAKELLQAKSPLVLIGSEANQGSGSFEWASCILVNLLLGNFNQKGGLVALPEVQVISDAPSRLQLSQNVLANFLSQVAGGQKQVDTLLVYEANPLYALPKATQVEQAWAKVGFKVSFSTFLDETALQSDLILPSAYFLERYDDVYTPFGCANSIYSIGAPVLKPITDSKSIPDFILNVAKQVGVDLGYSSFEDVLKAKAQKLGADFDKLVEGEAYVGQEKVAQTGLSLNPEVLGNGLQPESEGLFFAPLVKNYYGNLQQALTPTQVVVIPDTELKNKYVYVQINSSTARKLKLKSEDKVKLQGSGAECVAKVHITETVMNDVILMPLGFGHSAWDEYVKGKGDNALKVLNVVEEKGSGLKVWTRSQVKVVRA